VELTVAAPAPQIVEGDAQRLGQVLDNLLSNALRAVRGGGAVRLTVDGDRDSVLVTVEDDGVGIPARDLDRIFERFYRSADARPEDGTGVGLTVSRGIAEAHGGSLSAASDGPGRGARFVLTIPRADLHGHQP
jgi:signal transduction histidine kinase